MTVDVQVPASPPIHIPPPPGFKNKTHSKWKAGIATIAKEGSDPKTISGGVKSLRGVMQSAMLFSTFGFLKVFILPLSFTADVIKPVSYTHLTLPTIYSV